MPIVIATSELNKDISPYILEVTGLPRVESKQVKVLVNRNVMPNVDEYSVWVPCPTGLFKTVEEALNNIQMTRYGLLASLRIPEEIENVDPGEKRDRLLKEWYAKLYTACYLEIFKQYPHLYPVLMKSMNVTTYPDLWSSQFNTLMNDCILGKLENTNMYLGYLKLPSQGGRGK